MAKTDKSQPAESSQPAAPEAAAPAPEVDYTPKSPEAKFSDPNYIEGDSDFVRARVVHGSIRKDGREIANGAEIEMPTEEAKQYEALGVVAILRRPA